MVDACAEIGEKINTISLRMGGGGGRSSEYVKLALKIASAVQNTKCLSLCELHHLLLAQVYHRWSIGAGHPPMRRYVVRDRHRRLEGFLSVECNLPQVWRAFPGVYSITKERPEPAKGACTLLLGIQFPSVGIRTFHTTATGGRVLLWGSDPPVLIPGYPSHACMCQSCVFSVIASAQASTPSSETLTSLTLEHLYTWAGASCYSFTGAFGDGLQACQVRTVISKKYCFSPSLLSSVLAVTCPLFARHTSLMSNRGGLRNTYRPADLPRSTTPWMSSRI